MSKKLKKIIPDLRFPAFNGDWTAKRLSEISNEIGDGLHGTPKYNEDGEYYFVNGNNLINNKIEFGENTKLIDESEYLKCRNALASQTILISINGTIGNLAFYNYEKIALGKSICYINLISEGNKIFVFYLLQTSSIKSHFNKELTGSTIKNLSLATIRNTKPLFPSYKEQEKIASFLGAIDQRLTQLRRKYELLQTYKRGVMQKIFSQEIRFPEFKNDWIYSTLGKVTKYTKGFAFKSEDYLDNGIRIIRASDFDNQRIRQENQKVCVSEEFAENDKIKKYTVYKGNIIISTVGSKPELRSSAVGRGVYVCSDSEGLLNQNLLKFENIEDVNNRFLFAQINTSRYVDYISSIQRGNANQSNITVKDLLDYQIFITSLEEQEKIADFLTAIDQKIEAVARQVDRTEHFKKGLLQKMFV